MHRASKMLYSHNVLFCVLPGRNHNRTALLLPPAVKSCLGSQGWVWTLSLSHSHFSWLSITPSSFQRGLQVFSLSRRPTAWQEGLWEQWDGKGRMRGGEAISYYLLHEGMEESEATSRNRQEVNGGKQVMKVLTKHSEVKKKVERVEPGGTTTDHQETGNAKREIPTVPKWEAERWAIHNQN